MRRLQLALLFPLLLSPVACSGGKPEETGDADADTDTDSDTDSDADADSDTDVAADEDGEQVAVFPYLPPIDAQPALARRDDDLVVPGWFGLF